MRAIEGNHCEAADFRPEGAWGSLQGRSAARISFEDKVGAPHEGWRAKLLGDKVPASVQDLLVWLGQSEELSHRDLDAAFRRRQKKLPLLAAVLVFA